MNGSFTTREREIIRLIAEGTFCDKELACELAIAPRTVRVHLQNIFDKLRKQMGRDAITRVDVAIYSILAGYADTGKLRVKYAIPDERMAAAAPL